MNVGFQKVFQIVFLRSWEVELLDYMVVVFLILGELFILFSIETELVYICFNPHPCFFYCGGW